MRKLITAEDVKGFRADMDKGKTAKSARRRMAEIALKYSLLTDEARAEWLKELI